MTIPSNLGDIRTKVRRLTGRYSQSQLSDTELDKYINTYYVFDFPEELRILNLKTKYTFVTEPNVDVYNLDPNTYLNIEQPVYASGYQISYYQDYQSFFQMFPYNSAVFNLGTGDGVTANFIGIINNSPIISNKVLVSAVDFAGNPLSALDNGLGVLIGDVVGSTINYISGAINITFTSPPGTGEPIRVSYVPYVAARPLALLFFNNTFTLRPIPDQAYKMELLAWKLPTELLGAADNPEYNEIWQLIAYGAALKIFGDNLDMDSYGKVNILYEKQRTLIGRKTLKQLSTQKVRTIYSTTDFYPYGGQYPYL